MANRDPGNKKPLYRKVNTKARGVHHLHGGDAADSRSSRKLTRELYLGKMPSTVNRGRDYTPLFRFLLAKVGEDWNSVFSEAVKRLDSSDPIFWMVTQDEQRKDFICVGESTYFSGLYVDENGLLQRVNPALTAATMIPFCNCCTHTFNGVVFGRPFSERTTYTGIL